ncbi:hypothetical protein VT25_16395 [Photobacterium leiognathi subsp. mandapamensis]|nr:hypothetical protein VT25_16395 [Photobacterium leiognathi subsp. mandapamensis]
MNYQLVIQKISYLFVMLSLVLMSQLSYANMSKVPEPDNEIPQQHIQASPLERELKCTGGSIKTCTSNYVFPCPKGWTSCPLKGDNKTCCKQQIDLKIRDISK